MTDYEGFEPARIKHLEMIQAVVSRLAGNSFLVKGWALTLAGAFLGFAVTTHERALAMASIAPTLIFWVLDTYFLRSERLFRVLYNRVRTRGELHEPFFMGATSKDFISGLKKSTDEGERDAAVPWKTGWRPMLALYYLAIIGAALLIAWLVGISSSGSQALPSPHPPQ
jgi:hypothetical protein